ncbi:hypothetical protein EBB07_19445 [Paenibacillaceae bacterium]|nr:hypothetical protein EBB07_19445 [Paenibacillaceae bacterium]
MKLMDRRIEPRHVLPFEMRPVPQALVLELLNHAVWAPNHRLREPWKFIYIANDNREGLEFFHKQVPAHLIVTMKNESDAYKHDENLAAVFCLIQNFKLLAWEKKLGVNVSFYDWMFDRGVCQKLGIPEKERIAAVLDLGFYLEIPEAKPASVASLKWRLL